jgi:hypothetical protein
MTSFDPNSNDAMFARVLAKLEEQAAVLKEIKEQGQRAEHRIALLESWREDLKGRVAVVATVVAFLATAVVNVAIRVFLH